MYGNVNRFTNEGPLFHIRSGNTAKEDVELDVNSSPDSSTSIIADKKAKHQDDKSRTRDLPLKNDELSLDEEDENGTGEDDGEGEGDSPAITLETAMAKLRRIWKQKQFIHTPSAPQSSSNVTTSGVLSSSALYEQLLQQLRHPAQWSGGKLWLEQDFALSLRGLAVLAQHPQLLQGQGQTPKAAYLPRAVIVAAQQNK